MELSEISHEWMTNLVQFSTLFLTDFFSYFGIGVEFKQNVKWVVAKRHLTWASVSQKIVFLLEGIYEAVFLIIGTIP